MTDLESVLHSLRATVDPDDARALLARAAVDGVNPQELRMAWDDWRRLVDREVKTLYSSDGMASA